MQIEISSETVERVNHILHGVPKGAEKAFSNAINRGLSKAKTTAFKEVKNVYEVNNSAINEKTRTRIQKANAGNIAGYINFSGAKIPLYKFKVTPTVPGTGKKVFAAQEKGGGNTFEDAFIAQMKTGHLGIFERKETKRLPIEEKMGSAMAQMVKNTVVMEAVQKEAQKTVDERIEYEIDRILSGYGG